MEGVRLLLLLRTDDKRLSSFCYGFSVMVLPTLAMCDEMEMTMAATLPVKNSHVDETCPTELKAEKQET